ncbi:unnamed protein product [marine sediment metagenome]|uniref:Uncharacterized protein n=1 Tax=marine sediment metagenome TaxID=412755 RepID=X0ZQT4_9ZZZZ
MTTLADLRQDVEQLRRDIVTETGIGEQIIIICRDGNSDEAKAAGRAEWEERRGRKIPEGADVLHICFVCGDGPDVGLVP